MNVLVIDDDPKTTRLLTRLLTNQGYTVKEENDSRRALETAQIFQPDFVILDYSMPEVHGGDVAWQLTSDSHLRHARIIVCSGMSRSEIRNKLPPARIPILEKPVDADALLGLLHEN